MPNVEGAAEYLLVVTVVTVVTVVVEGLPQADKAEVYKRDISNAVSGASNSSVYTVKD